MVQKSTRAGMIAVSMAAVVLLVFIIGFNVRPDLWYAWAATLVLGLVFIIASYIRVANPDAKERFFSELETAEKIIKGGGAIRESYYSKLQNLAREAHLSIPSHEDIRTAREITVEPFRY